MQNSLPLILEPETLGALTESDYLLIVDLSSEQSYLSGHVPGAVHLPAQALLRGSPPAPGKLAEIEQLNKVFSYLGLTPETHCVVYDDEGGGWAGRFIWTLDVIGHSQYSYLNGGINAWKGAGLPLETLQNTPQSKEVNVSIHTQPIAEIEDIMNGLEQDNFLVWDARSPIEFRGEKVLAQKGGHIPGATNCEWTQLMDTNRYLRIRKDALEFLAQLGITADKHIVTHCQTHHRSGFTYLVGKALGFNIRAYHGSWAEWGNDPNTPVER